MKRVTLIDVAEHAKVSRAAASLALRGTGRLSDETRTRVLASMKELGYVYHRGAASLRTRRTNIVGVLVTDISNPSFTKFTLALEESLSKAGYFTMLSNTFDDQTREVELIRSFLEYPVDALVYVPAAHDSAEVRSLLENAQVPVLAVTRQQTRGRSYLGADNEFGGALAARHLAEVHGCRRFAYLGGPAAGTARQQRLKGVRSVIRDVGAQLELELEGQTAAESAREIAAAAISADVAFDAVICHSDLVAYAFIAAWRRSARGPLMSVIGFDNLPTSEFIDPPITSIAVGDLGTHAAKRVLAMLDGGAPAVQLMKPRLEIRQSCGC